MGPWKGSATPPPGGFRRFLIASAASRFGDALIPVSLVFAVMEQSGSVAVLGVVLIASRAPMAAMLPLAGVLADRYAPFIVMALADVVRVVAQGLTAWLLMTNNLNIGVLCALQVVVGLAGAAFEPASQAALPRLVAPEDLRRANGALTSARNLLGILAQPAAAAMVVASSSAWAFAVDSLTFLLSAVAVWSLRAVIGNAAAAVGESFRSQLVGGWRYVRDRSWLLRLIGFTAALNMVGVAPFLVLGPVLAERQGGGPVTWGAAATGFAAGAVLGGLVAMRLTLRRPVRVAVLSAAAICPLFLAFAAGLPAAVLAVLAAVAGAQTSVLNVISSTAIQRRTPSSHLGRVMSFVFFGSMILLPVGLGVTGAVGDLIGPDTALLASGAAVLVCVGATAWAKDLDTEESELTSSEPQPASASPP